MLNAKERAELEGRARAEKALAQRQAEVERLDAQLNSVRAKQLDMQVGREKAAEQYRKGEISQNQYARNTQVYNEREGHYIQEEKSLMAEKAKTEQNLKKAEQDLEKQGKAEAQSKTQEKERRQ